jgi:hypothetical protein
MGNGIRGKVAQIAIREGLLGRRGSLIQDGPTYGPVVGVLVQPGQTLCENDIRTDAPVEEVIGVALQKHSQAVLEEWQAPESLQPDLQVCYRSPRVSL